MTAPAAAATAAEGRRGFILCLDGENLELLERFATEFDLPNIRAMLATGLKGAQDPGLLPVSAPAWASFMTGNWAEKHGVYGFFDHDDEKHTDTLVDHRSLKCPSLIAAADRQGANVLWLNLPLSTPSSPLRHGQVVSGFLVTTPEGVDAWPRELVGEIRALIPGYETRLPDSSGGPVKRQRTRLEILVDLARRMLWRPIVLRHLLSKGRPRLAVVHCQETDVIHHVAWSLAAGTADATAEEREAIRTIYRTADALAGILRETVGPEGMGLLLSDHGGHAMRWVVQPNDVLASWGFATLLEGADGTLSLADEFGMSPVVRARRWLRRKFGPEKGPPSERFRSAHANRELLLDFERTRIYAAIGDNSCVLFHGDAAPLAAEEREALRRRLADLRLPDGDPAFSEVRVVAGGAGKRGGPVLAARASDGVYISRRTGGGAFRRVEDPYSGTHRRHGMFCWSGPGIPAGTSDAALPMVDVLPTMFGAIGLSTPPDLDGRAWAGLPAAAGAAPWSEGALDAPLPDAPATAKEEEELKARLRDLGYIG